MSIGKSEKAKKVLIMYSKLARNPIDLDGVSLVTGGISTKDEKKPISVRVSDKNI